MSKVFYIYESHLGGFYHTEKKLSFDERYCDECGDSDWLLCTAAKPQDIWDALEGQIDEKDSEGNWTGGWDKDYVKEFIEAIPWEKLNDDTASKKAN